MHVLCSGELGEKSHGSFCSKSLMWSLLIHAKIEAEGEGTDNKCLIRCKDKALIYLR